MQARTVITTLAVIGALYVGICALAWAFQDRLVWFPGPPPATDPGRYGLEFEDVTLTTSDGVDLHAWFLPGTTPATVLISHGNGGTIENVIPLAKGFRDMGASVLVYDYRGYGKSAGNPTEEGTYLDAEAAFDWLIARGNEPGDIIAYGHSLGGAVTVALATRRPLKRMIVENTFTSLADVGAKAYPFLPVRLLSRIHYDSVADAPDVRASALVIHSPGDELIPIELGRRLFDALGGDKAYLPTAGGHNDGGFLLKSEWRNQVHRFIHGDPAR